MSQQIRVVKKRLKKRDYVAFYLYLLFVLLSLFVMASYTWFSLSRTPSVSNMNVYITSATGLELSADPGEDNWQLQLSVWDTGCIPTELRPVTWSENDGRFWAASYGSDGRLMDYAQWQPLTDSRHANTVTTDGYYMKSTFYARSGMRTEVRFAPAMVVDEAGTQGSGTYVIGVASWDMEGLLHLNSGKGAESAIRIGLRATPVDSSGTPTGSSGGMFLYEPNADRHVGDSSGYIKTPSIDGTDTLVPEERMVLQTASGWADLETPEISNIKLTLGEFITNPVLFTVEPGQVMKIELYIWLEGQDVDCVNPMNGAQLMANLQFTGSTDTQSGMVTIE